jgi:hypothetical protein
LFYSVLVQTEGAIVPRRKTRKTKGADMAEDKKKDEKKKDEKQPEAKRGFIPLARPEKKDPAEGLKAWKQRHGYR